MTRLRALFARWRLPRCFECGALIESGGRCERCPNPFEGFRDVDPSGW